MPEKTYTVVRYTLFTQEEFRELLRRAHEECKREVPITAHRIGKNKKRLMISHPRQQYLACIKRKIEEAIKERIQSVGATVTA